MSRSGAHEALHDHRLDLLIAELTRPVPMPECETAAPMAAGDPMNDDVEYLIWDPLEERWIGVE